MFCVGVTAGIYAAGHWPSSEQVALRNHLDARSSENRLLADRLSLLEASLARVDALGQRLVLTHDLDGEEFNFDARPGVGGFGAAADDPIGQLHEGIRLRETKLRLLADFLGRNSRREQTLPRGWPVESGWISSNYGRRTDPFTGRPEMHQGIDIGGSEGAKVLAVAGGVVTQARRARNYGLLVEIDHGNGYRTRYAHNQLNLVRVGDIVRRGEAVALLGDTGRSTGPHVHFEILKHGRNIHPGKYMARR